MTKKTFGPAKRRQGIERPIVVLFLVFVTVVVAITNAFWMGGLASNLTKREQVEIPIVSATKQGDDGWTIMAQLKNTGGANATIDGSAGSWTCSVFMKKGRDLHSGTRRV